MFLFPSWERPVVGNLSDIVGPNCHVPPILVSTRCQLVAVQFTRHWWGL
eukprot:COSAG02_NODE_28084_length_596_cov_1.645875_1_plen_48_part_10